MKNAEKLILIMEIDRVVKYLRSRKELTPAECIGEIGALKLYIKNF